MAARGEGFGERDERAFGAAQGRPLRRPAVERDPVIRHGNEHQAAAPATRSMRRRAAASAASTLRLSISVPVVR